MCVCACMCVCVRCKARALKQPPGAGGVLACLEASGRGTLGNTASRGSPASIARKQSDICSSGQVGRQVGGRWDRRRDIEPMELRVQDSGDFRGAWHSWGGGACVSKAGAPQARARSSSGGAECGGSEGGASRARPRCRGEGAFLTLYAGSPCTWTASQTSGRPGPCVASVGVPSTCSTGRCHLV